MSNQFNRLLSLMPKPSEFIGTIQQARHPDYAVLVVDGTGLVMCTSSTVWQVGDRVFIAGTEIKREAIGGQVLQIEV